MSARTMKNVDLRDFFIRNPPFYKLINNIIYFLRYKVNNSISKSEKIAQYLDESFIWNQQIVI